MVGYVGDQLNARRRGLRGVRANHVSGQLSKVDQLSAQRHILVRVRERAQAGQHPLHPLGLGDAVVHSILGRLAAIRAPQDRQVGHDRRKWRRHLMRNIGQESPLRGQDTSQLFVCARLRLDRAIHSVDHRQHDQGQRRSDGRFDRQH